MSNILYNSSGTSLAPEDAVTTSGWAGKGTPWQNGVAFQFAFAVLAQAGGTPRSKLGGSTHSARKSSVERWKKPPCPGGFPVKTLALYLSFHLSAT